MKTRHASLGVVAALLSTTAIMAGTTTASAVPAVLTTTTAAVQAQAEERAALRLPRLDVRVRGPVPDEEKAEGRISVRADGKTEFRGRIGIERRGQSSQRFPKKPYGFEVRDRTGDNRDVKLLGMPADDDWILYPSYTDKTLMRNVIAFGTARWMGGYAARTRYVELWLNGRYRGVYVLMEKLKLQDERVDKPEPAQLLEWTSDPQSERKGVDFRLPFADVPVLFEDPERDDLTRQERAEVRRSVIAADRALYSPTFADPVSGWRAHLDEAAAVDFVLLNELFQNNDAFISSVYLARGEGELWTLGPIWDFDTTLGNMDRGPASVVEGSMVSRRPWAERLYADPAFVAALAARWRELRAAGVREHLLAQISTYSTRLVLTRAATRNFRRWPVLGRDIGPNPPESVNRTTYDSEVRAMTTWLEGRVAWLDANVGALAPGRPGGGDGAG